MATRKWRIPFWSHANGMKDIIWYTPTRQADGSYTVTAKASDHENADGKYEAQVFYVDAQGQNKFVKRPYRLYGDKTGQCCRSWSDHYKIRKKTAPSPSRLRIFKASTATRKWEDSILVSCQWDERYHLVYSDSPGRWFIYCNSQQAITKMLMANTKRRSSM